jgi:hypothetical protein
VLIGALEGVQPDDPWPVDEDGPPEIVEAADRDSVIFQAGNRTLVGRRGDPPTLWWVERPRC